MTDLIGMAHMTQGEKTTFTSDRFGNANSALALNGGWTQVPPGIYFNSPEFTITVWVYIQVCTDCEKLRIIDFSNGRENEDQFYFGLMIYSYDIFKPYFFFLPGYVQSVSTLTMNEWQFLSVTYNGSIMRIYKNGRIILERTMSISLSRINRTNCFIGKSYMDMDRDGYSRFNLDELKFYIKGLTEFDINRLYKKGKKIQLKGARTNNKRLR
jgi:hypothetical protein